MTEAPWTTEELEAFLIEAYAEAWPRNVNIVHDAGDLHGFERVRYDRLPWTYTDLYYGSSNDGGMELVRHNSVPIWMNVYRGGLTTAVEQFDVFGFLVRALDASNGTGTYRPRGPVEFTSEEVPLKYLYSGHGNLTRFFGIEVIKHNEVVLYERTVTGGLVGQAPVLLPGGFHTAISTLF